MGDNGKRNAEGDSSPHLAALTGADVRRRLEAIMGELAGLLTELNGSPSTAGELAVTDRLLTVKQAADRLGLSESQVYKQARSWPFTRKLSAKALRFSATGLERWCLEHAAPAAEGKGR